MGAQHLVVKPGLARIHHLAPLGRFKHCRRSQWGSRWGGQAPGEASRSENRGRQPDVHPGRFKIKVEGGSPLSGSHSTSPPPSVHPFVLTVCLS